MVSSLSSPISDLISTDDNMAEDEPKDEPSIVDEDEDDTQETLDPPKVLLSQSKSLSTSENELQFTSPISRGIKYSQSLRVKREPGHSSKADRSGWSLGNMAKALSTGVVQGTMAVGSGVVQGTMAVGSGVVQGTKAVGSGVVQGSLVVGSGVVQGSKAVGTGVVQGTKVVSTGVVQGTLAAGRMTKDVTIAVGKGVYHASEVVGNAAVTGVSAAGEATVSAGRVVNSASVSLVMDTTKWVKEQSESFGGDDHEMYTVLPGDSLDEVAQRHGVAVYDLIRINQLQRRLLIPGKQIIIPDETDQIKPHPDEILVTKAFMITDSGDEDEGVVRFSTERFTFTSKGSLVLDCHPREAVQILLDVCEAVDCVPDLLPAHSFEENDNSCSNSSTNSCSAGESGNEPQRQQQHCHIVEVDLGTDTIKREQPNLEDDWVILELMISTAAKKEEEDEEKIEKTDEEEVEDSVGEKDVDADDDNDDENTKKHLFKFRFPLGDLASLHSYLELWQGDRLQTTEAFQKHLLLESSGLIDCDDSGPHILDDSFVLDDRHLREIYRSLPHKIQNQSWSLAYSTRVNGFSLQNLYRTLADEKEPFLVVIQDNLGFNFGAYLTCTPRVCENFIGTGKSWIFSFGRIEPAPKELFEDEDENGQDDSSELIITNPHHLRVFHWSGRNEYFFRGTLDNLIIGAGDGKFGIVVDGDLHKGRIQECDTFEGWPQREQDFIISCLECWRFV